MAERAVGSGSYKGKMLRVPPLRMRVAVRIAESLVRKNKMEMLESDELLAEVFVETFALFRFLPRREVLKTAYAVRRQLKLDEAKLPRGLRVVRSHVGSETLSGNVWNALKAGEPLDGLARRFPQVGTGTLAECFVDLAEAGVITRNRLRECSGDRVLARAVMNRIVDL